MVYYYAPGQESISGTSLTGTDGEANRTYTLTDVNAVAAGMAVYVDGIILQADYHYTLGSGIITFLVPIYDTAIIIINYQALNSTISPSGTSYTSASLVQAELRTSTAFGSLTYPSLDTVNTWIEEESRYIDILTNQVYSSTTVSSCYVDYNGDDVLRFPHAPLISITKVEYNVHSTGANPSWVQLTEGFDKNFISYLPQGEIEFINGVNATVKCTPVSGTKRFRLSYVYGTSTIPLDIQKLATLLVTKRVLLSLASSQANTEGGSIQIGTIQITDPTSYGISYISNLGKEIDDYVAKIGRGFKVYRPTRVY